MQSPVFISNYITQKNQKRETTGKQIAPARLADAI
jgi:hypothetical protein